MTHYKTDSKLLAKLTPTWRFMLLIMVSSASFMIYDGRFYLANLAITFVLEYLTNISYKALVKPVTLYFYPLIIIFSLHAIGADWLDGTKVILRFCNMAIFASWVLSTTSYADIADGLASLLKPLSYFGLKPAKISLAFTLALRFMPLIMDSFNEVKMAQHARGIDKNFKVILIPWIIKIIKMADTISEAIEIRSCE